MISQKACAPQHGVHACTCLALCKRLCGAKFFLGDGQSMAAECEGAQCLQAFTPVHCQACCSMCGPQSSHTHFNFASGVIATRCMLLLSPAPSACSFLVLMKCCGRLTEAGRHQGRRQWQPLCASPKQSCAERQHASIPLQLGISLHGLDQHNASRHHAGQGLRPRLCWWVLS